MTGCGCHDPVAFGHEPPCALAGATQHCGYACPAWDCWAQHSHGLPGPELAGRLDAAKAGTRG